MSTTINDVMEELYETDLYRNLNDLIPISDDRINFSELISTIFSLHIYMEALIEKILISTISFKFDIENSNKISTIINNLGFAAKINFIESIEVGNRGFIKYLTQLNSIRNKLAHKDNIQKIVFFEKEIFSREGFEELREKTDIALNLLKSIESEFE